MDNIWPKSGGEVEIFRDSFMAKASLSCSLKGGRNWWKGKRKGLQRKGAMSKTKLSMNEGSSISEQGEAFSLSCSAPKFLRYENFVGRVEM